MHEAHPDTIAAIATPLGAVGAISVVRISGPDSLNIIKAIFKPTTNKAIASHRIRQGWIMDGTKVIDQVVVSYMANPRSYTGEDVVEISCHGGALAPKNVLELAIKAGARLARRGEFTKRAFMNGKIDLAQAEAVIDLIKAKTKEGSYLAAAQLSGSLSFKIMEIRNKLMGLITEIEASIDFPDEIPEIDTEKAKKRIVSALEHAEKLMETSDIGKAYRQGVSIAIVGKPNVGKSSLMNAFLKEERAIVTEEPGTTRDLIEETLNIKGVPAIIIDMAGIRRSTNRIELAGIERASRAIDKADMALIVLDMSQELTPEDIDIIDRIGDSPRILVLNKEDLPHRIRNKDVIEKAGEGTVAAEISALTGKGVGELENKIYDLMTSNKVVAENTEVMINLRHKESLIRAKELMEKCLESINNHMQADFVSIDLKGAVAALGEVTGEVVSEEVIDRIFEEFCVGK